MTGSGSVFRLISKLFLNVVSVSKGVVEDTLYQMEFLLNAGVWLFVSFIDRPSQVQSCLSNSCVPLKEENITFWRAICS